MKKITKFLTDRIYTILLSIFLSILVELTPIVLPNSQEKLNRIFYALIAILISIIFENYLRRKEFEKSSVDFIKKLKELRIQYSINSDIIISIMTSTTFEMATILNQTKNLEKDLPQNLDQEIGNLNCSICSKEHLTDYYGRCQNCKLSSKLWKQI
jgi:hypothetical protein